jgi:hypothetical protein
VANPPLAIKARVLAAVTRLAAVLLVPAAFCRAPGRARFLACQWALGLRFPREDLCGLAPEALTAFTRARAEAFWRDGQLIGLTSGYRDAAEQHRIFTEEVRRTGSVPAARRRVLPPEESRHVRGSRSTSGRPRARGGSNSTAGGTGSTASTTTSGGTSSAARPGRPGCRIQMPRLYPGTTQGQYTLGI